MRHPIDINADSGGTFASPRDAASHWSRAAELTPTVFDLIRQFVDAPGILGRAAHHHLDGGGKAFRARLLMASALALDLEPDVFLPAAAACELLHNASLVHDDMQDQDAYRRHRTTVWHEFGPDAALCLGDHFISQTHALLAQTPDATAGLRISGRFAAATSHAIVGQLQEASANARNLPNWSSYVAMAEGKSGALFALPVQTACDLAGLNDVVNDAVERALSLYGVAYQIKDDLLDILGGKEGRPAGTDLAPGKANALVALAVDAGETVVGEALRPDVAPEAKDALLAHLRRPESLERLHQAHASILCRAMRHATLMPQALWSTAIEGLAQIVALPAAESHTAAEVA